MKNLFTALAIFSLVFTACEQLTDNNSGNKLPNLTIRNESSFVLTDVKFSSLSFSASDLEDLPTSTQSIRQLSKNDLNKAGYITFTRKDIGISCRTEAINIADQDYTFTFLDTSIVEEVGNSNNKRTLYHISYLSKIVIERDGLNIEKNATVNLRETVINNSRDAAFTIKSTGDAVLFLIGQIKISSTSNVFTVIQPARWEIDINDSVTFRIMVNPIATGTHNATVTVGSNDRDGDFSFNIIFTAVSSKPIATVICEGNEIPQNGTIDAGNIMITQKKNFVVTIKNDGTEILLVNTANSTITGADAALFVTTTNPNGSILQGNQSSFVIEYTPVSPGMNNAVLTIPTNDASCNSIIVNLKATAIPVFFGTVTYNANGGTGTVPAEQTVIAFSDITLPSGNGLSKTGFVFAGWITSISGSGVSYNANASYTVTGNITIYAKWVIDMVHIEGGTFLMGSPASEHPPMGNETQHQVTLTNGFYMGKHEVTQAQYLAITGTNPSWNYRINLPVESVTWYDAVEFCNKLSVLEGLERVYTISGRIPLNGYPIKSATVTMDMSRNGYRLPTEAEWEYACRAGTITAYNTGATINTNQASFNYAMYRPSEVGSFLANGFGLYDMHGNIAEWCWDRCGFFEDYPRGPQTDPTGSASGAYRIIRGGAYDCEDWEIRSGSRSFDEPSGRSSSTGFRLARK